jgi:uncharacterized membrane protein
MLRNSFSIDVIKPLTLICVNNIITPVKKINFALKEPVIMTNFQKFGVCLCLFNTSIAIVLAIKDDGYELGAIAMLVSSCLVLWKSLPTKNT